MKKVTTSIILETRKTLSDGTHPVKLRITYDRKQKYYTLNTSPNKLGLTVAEWKKVNKSSVGEYKTISLALQKNEMEAIDVIQSMPVFSFDLFESLYFKKESKIDLYAALLERYESLIKDERLRTAEVYRNALNSFKSFSKSDNMPFAKVTPDWLRSYEKWMTKKNNSTTTISMYIRTVRALFNQAEIAGDMYPFGSKKYEIPESRNIKKALPISDMKLIFEYDAAPGSFRERYRDYWVLSYLCGGANITDLAHLKYKNVDSDSIIFIRAKTAHKKKKRTTMIALTKEIARIIDKYKQPYTSPETYLLPILNDDMNAKQRLVAIRNTVRGINKHIKVIAANIGIHTTVTTYTARHTFATVCRNAGFSIEQISELMGNTPQSTKEYLADLEISQKQKMAAILTNWNDG